MYLYLLNGHIRYLLKFIWKLKVPLKINIFMCFLHRQCILTRDNLAKRNWQANTKCCFYDKGETVQHMFIPCHFAKTICRIVHMTFNITLPTNINTLFGNWLNEIGPKDKDQIRVGVCALLWAMWNVHNDFVFNK